METLVKHVMRAAVTAKKNDLVVNCWSPRKAMELYVCVIHLFDFPCLVYDKRRRYETRSWDTYFNVLMKRKGKLFGEQWWFCIVVKRLVQSGKIFIIIILNFNAFTINIRKQFIECLGKTQGTGKKNALPSPPNHLQSFWPAAPLCPPTIVLWIGQHILFMSVCAPQPLS